MGRNKKNFWGTIPPSQPNQQTPSNIFDGPKVKGQQENNDDKEQNERVFDPTTDDIQQPSHDTEK